MKVKLFQSFIEPEKSDEDQNADVKETLALIENRLKAKA